MLSIAMYTVTKVALCFLVCYFTLIKGAPSSLSRGQFYPTKGVSDPIRSEALQCGSIRDVIRRNTARYRKVLIRSDNSMIDFGSNGDNRYMTSRAKSKLDVLATRVQSTWGSAIKLRVEKAWTDVVDKNDMLSLHYEGRKEGGMVIGFIRVYCFEVGFVAFLLVLPTAFCLITVLRKRPINASDNPCIHDLLNVMQQIHRCLANLFHCWLQSVF